MSDTKPQAVFDRGQPGFVKVVSAVGRVTFSDIIRDKILYNIFVFAILLLGVGLLASRLTYVRAERIVLDFGLAAVAISSSLIAGLTGAGLMGKELERRTIYVALSHPITRAQFVTGKYAGLAGVIAVNWALLSAAFLLIVNWTGDGFSGIGPHPYVVLWALFFVLLEALIVGSLAVFFSTFSTTSLSAMFTLGIYLVGNNVSQIRFVAERLKSNLSSAALRSLAAITPDLQHYHLGLQITYGLNVEWRLILIAVSYAAVVITLALIFSGILVKGKEV